MIAQHRVIGWALLWPGVLLATAALAAGAEAKRAPWHLPAWAHRQEVHLLAVDGDGRINAAEVTIEASPGSFAEDGRDLRVLDEKGNPVGCHLVDAKGRMVSGRLPKGECVRVHFQVGGASARRYFVYYGNSLAGAVWTTWTKKLGGLTLETRAPPKQMRRPAANFRYLKKLLNTAGKVYGSGPRRQINDPANPYGPDDYYLATYRGLIFCPVEGQYLFGTDSDDSSFLLINGKLVVQWPGGHNPSGTFDHHGLIYLKAGIHQIEYYHVQAGGGALARAGWRPPQTPDFVLIPEDAFVKALPTRTVRVEQRDSPLSVFFEGKVLACFQFGHEGPFVAKVAFTDRSASTVAEIAVRMWTFEGGDISTEQNPTKILLGPRTRTVTLRCVDELGYETTWTRRLRLDAGGVRRVDVAMEVAAEQPLLLKDEPLHVKVKTNNASLQPLAMELVAVITLPDGMVIARWREALSLAAKSWHTTEYRIAKASGIPFTTGRIRFQLEYERFPILTRDMVVCWATDKHVRPAARGGNLVDADGTQIVLRLSEARYAQRKMSFKQRLGERRTATVVFVDDALGAGGDASYINFFAAYLRAAFPKVAIRTVRVGERGQEGHSRLPFERATVMARVAKEVKPDLVVVAGSLRDIIRFDSAERFERKLRVLLDRVEAVCGAPVVLIAPPPAIGNPGFGQDYAIAVKRVGLLKHIPVADVYSAFLTSAPADGWRRRTERQGRDDWHRFYRDPDSPAPIYHLAPTRAGQALLAQTLWRAIFPDRPVPRIGSERGREGSGRDR